MSRAQYIALCMVGALAIIAYMNTRKLAAILDAKASGLSYQAGKAII